MEQDREIIMLYDEDNNEEEFEVIAVLDVDTDRYAILMPLSEDSIEEEEAVILRIDEDEDGEKVLVGLDDQDELDMVIEAYEEMVKQQEDQA